MENYKYRILVVDDDPGILMLIKHKLKKQGFDVITSQDSKKAFELLKEGEHIDLIICDILMPQMNGYEFRQHVLDNPSIRDIPFIFLTASTEPVDQVKGFKLRVDDYITKPFDSAVLIARVQSVLERHAVYREKMTTDQLTGLLNRKALEEKVQRELERIRRYGEKCSLVFIDIDDFKQVNDLYGHDKGDLVLIQFARLITQEIRTTDIIGRYGGEEFLLCLVNTDKELAYKVSERLLSIFRDIPIGDEKIHCTFSAGIVSAPQDGTDFTELCKKADEAMYISKKNGKNRVTKWQETN